MDPAEFTATDPMLNYPDFKRELEDNPMNFVEIRRIPKKVEPRALTSMIVSISRILPKMTEINFKEGTMERVALVEFKNPVDAFRAVDKLRMSPIGNTWRMRIMGNPKYLNPSKEILDKLSR